MNKLKSLGFFDPIKYLNIYQQYTWTCYKEKQ